VNINNGCGSTHLEKLQEMMKTGRFAIGCAFDGDADRCLLVDETGEVIDGDHIMGILADFMKKNGKLKGGAVGTIITNLGLHAFLEERNIPILSTKVGDRYVLECMRAEGWNIGGEQSGHVILSDNATTGDGQLTALQFIMMLREKGCLPSELTKEIFHYPQIMNNVPVPNSIKKQMATLPEIEALSKEITDTFGGEGRINIRPSGTEALVRVMVEGSDADKVAEMAEYAKNKVAEVAAKMAQ
jgi:phosphoglucosamine mutase